MTVPEWHRELEHEARFCFIYTTTRMHGQDYLVHRFDHDVPSTVCYQLGQGRTLNGQCGSLY